MDASIQALVDRAELSDLVARHSLWMDEGQYDQSERLFTEDVVVTTSRGQAHGIDNLVALAVQGHQAYVRTMHSKSNLVITINGDHATVRVHDLAVYVMDDATAAVAAAIHRYTARRTDAGWRFDGLDVEPVALTRAIDRKR